jgi:hypothetical protein
MGETLSSCYLLPYTVIQGSDGKQRDSWGGGGATATRIYDLAVTPDSTRFVVVGESSGDPSRPIAPIPGSDAVVSSSAIRDDNNNTASGRPPMMLIVYDSATKQPKL